MRVSDYVIYVPIPRTEKTLLLHGYTGAIDLVNNRLATALIACKEGEVPSCFDSCFADTLVQRGYLTEKTCTEEVEAAARIGEMIYQKIREQVVNFVFIPSYDCNLRCRYCYQRTLRKKGENWITKKMDKPIVDAAFRAMEAIETEKVKLKRITLYGGEPFMASNHEVIAYILEKGKAKGYRFAFVTNGVELDDYLPIFDDERVDSIQITLDGPPEVHDRRRVSADGKGTFEEIAANIDRLLDRKIRVNVRVNLDKDNIEHIARLTQLFAERGWSGHRHFFSYVSPTHSLRGKKKGREVSLKELKLLSAHHGDPLSLPLPVNDYGIITRFAETLHGKGLFPFKPVFCGSNTSMYVFDPHGDIFTCWDPVGIPEEKVGRFLPELSLYPEKLLRWQGRLVSRVSGCKTCKYAFFCGGGCSYLGFLGQAGHSSPFCQEFPEILKADLLEAFFKSGVHSAFLKSTSDQLIH